VASYERWEVDVDETAVAYADLAVDDVQVDVRDAAEYQRCERVVDGAAGSG
jgi:hypothetical protein